MIICKEFTKVIGTVGLVDIVNWEHIRRDKDDTRVTQKKDSDCRDINAFVRVLWAKQYE